MELWSRRDRVTLLGAAGMYKSGWNELSRIFPWVSSRFSHVTDYSFEVRVTDVVGDWRTRSGTSTSPDRSQVGLSSR